MLALRLALRDLRGGLRGMRVVLACLALGVTAIAAVGSLRAAVERGLIADGRTLLGGDLAIDGGAQPLPEELRHWIQARGGRVSAIVTMRSLLVAPGGDRMLIDLKVVDGAYPLAGTVGLAPPMSLASALNGGVVADKLVLERLRLKGGERVRIGQSSLVLRAALTAEPDHVEGAGLLGPRVLMSQADLPATGLVQPGSLLTYEYRVVLPPGANLAATRSSLRAAFASAQWRIRDATQPAPGIERALQQTSLFLTLVGLSSLLVGGIGVATGVRAWLEGRAQTIATLRCLGAGQRLIFATFLIQVMALCSAGICAGVMAGAALPIAGIALFGDLLPVPARAGIYPVPLALAALYGLLTAGVFALWPLGRAARIPGAALFRGPNLPTSTGVHRAVAATSLGLGCCLIVAVVATSPDRKFALWFCLSALATLAAFRGGAWVLIAAARTARPLHPAWLRLGSANLHRPGSATPLLVVALGLGLATLVSVALIQGNIRREVLGDLPRDAPSFFFIDIQNDQLDRFAKIVHDQPGSTDLHEVPSLRARIVSLNGVPADKVHVSPDSQWALRGDRGLTYSAELPRGSRLVAGTWWPPNYTGAPLLSLDADLARGWHLAIGDTVTANVLGRDIDFRVASLRTVNWRGLAINFTLVASPGLLEAAPHMHIATLKTPPATEALLLRAVTDALPNVTGIRVSDVLQTVASVVGKLAAALTAAGSVTLGSGALVLAGAVAAGQRQRLADAVVLKTLGATRAQISAAWLVEFGLIGTCAGLIAALIGTLASWAVVHLVMHAPWSFLPGILALTIVGCIVLMLTFGYFGTAAVLRERAASHLRER